MADAEPPEWLPDLLAQARNAGEDVATALGIAARSGHLLPHPGAGETARRWWVLAEVARVNLTVARVLEAHTDALSILAESGADAPTGHTWGVFAAEAADGRLAARPGDDGTFTLTGTKPWCSLAGDLDAALVTAHTDEGRRLFRVELRQAGVLTEPPATWVARGLRTITSAPVHFTDVPSMPVGAPGWYLSRPGFAWGGIGVAACWHGGALGLRDTLMRAARAKPEIGEILALHCGAVDAHLHASASVLACAARTVDTAADDLDAALLAQRTRATVADAVERVLHQVGHALGPAPLAFNPDHAARVADLGLYVRQHHGERDLAALGAMVVEGRTR